MRTSTDDTALLTPHRTGAGLIAVGAQSPPGTHEALLPPSLCSCSTGPSGASPDLVTRSHAASPSHRFKHHWAPQQPHGCQSHNTRAVLLFWQAVFTNSVLFCNRAVLGLM